jgi:hypothetical protein
MDIPLEQLVASYEELKSYVDKRKETCRQSSRKYYNKKFKLSETPTEDELKKNKEALEKRDARQKSYYERNKEKILARQKAYRQRKKAEKELKFED